MEKAVERDVGVPVWSHAGIICTGETYKAVVKLTFAKGASLKDPSGLFNASLEGNVRRAIDIHEGDKIDEKALKALIRAAVALNISAASKPRLERAPARAEFPHLLGVQVLEVVVVLVVLLAIARAFGVRRRAFLFAEQAIEQAEHDHRSGDGCCRRYQDQKRG